MSWTQWKGALAGALAALVLQTLVFSGQAATLYSISRDDALLRTIDPATGATLTSIPMSHPQGTVLGANGLASDPTTNLLWATLRVEGAERNQRELVTIHPTTGAVTVIGNTEHAISTLAFDSAGTLYGVIGNAGSPPETMVTLSKTDASAPVFMPLGNGSDGEAIAFNPMNGLMYHWSGLGTPNVDEIFESINLQTKTTAPITLNGVDYSEALAGTFQETTRTFLISADFSDAKLYRVTLRGPNVFVSLVGDLDHQSKGLAFVVPEPTTAAAILSCIVWLTTGVGRVPRRHDFNRTSSRQKRSTMAAWFSNWRRST